MNAYYPFKFGTVMIEVEEETLIKLRCISESLYIENNQKNNFTDHVFEEFIEYLEGKRKSFDITYKLEGTSFQKKVWQEVASIPYGETRSYKQIAENIGSPKAFRAVGNANNKNPLLLIIPCHRVIGTNGQLTGYAGGLEMKQYLLELEKED